MSEKLAIDGGLPVRRELLPLIRVSVDEQERHRIESVLQARVFCSVMPAATKVKELEAAFADYVGAQHAVAFSSGTTAQHTSLATIGIGPGDEVIVPPLTFISTAYTVLMRGATVVFADVDEGTFNLDPAQVARRITPRTRAIVPVHWFGHLADMEGLMPLARKHDLTIIEDCAHAYGRRQNGLGPGAFGALACWSLQESKLITAAGEGGILTTDDEDLAASARTVRDHGKSPHRPPDGREYDVVTVGNNYRLTEIQAAFALAQLHKIDRFRARRREHTEYLDAALGPVPQLRRQTLSAGVERSYVYYPIRFLRDRFRVDLGRIARALTAEGIGVSAIAQEEFCPRHSLFGGCRGEDPLPYCPGTLPVAERIADELVILPLYPDLTRSDLDDIIAAVQKVVAAYGI